MKRTRLVLVLGLLTGCAGLIGVPDLTLDESPPDGGSIDTGPLGDVTIPPADTGSPPVIDGSPGDATIADATPDSPAVDSATCDLSKVQTDPLNCGACGLSCLGGECTAGKCGALALANVANGPLFNIVEHGPSLYVSTFISLTTQVGGIWVVPKAGGAAVKYVDKTYAEKMVVRGDTLYFVVNDTRADDAGNEGGLWRCDLKGPIPCVPTLVAPSEETRGLSMDNGYIYWADDNPDAGFNGIQRLAPEAGATPTLFRQGWGFPAYIWAGGEGFYYLVSFFGSPQRVSLFDVYPDAGDVSIISTYTKNNAASGFLTGTANALYFTAFDFSGTTGGVVRRVSRPGSAGTTPCDYNGTKNIRPRGLHLTDDRIYWTNQGATSPTPIEGSVNYCPLAGCCADATVVWTGDGSPSAITSDNEAIYWVGSESGNVYKIRKP